MSEISDLFFKATRSPSQAQVDWLVKRNGVPSLALARDFGEAGFVIGTASVVEAGRCLFDFAEPDDDEGRPAIIFVARDQCAEPVDLVAWLPKDDRVAALYGRTAFLGEQSILAPRLGGPLAVHRTPLGWLKAGREGVVLLDLKNAWRRLEGVKLAAEDIDHGLTLRKVLSAPPPSIVVPASVVKAERQAA